MARVEERRRNYLVLVSREGKVIATSTCSCLISLSGISLPWLAQLSSKWSDTSSLPKRCHKYEEWITTDLLQPGSSQCTSVKAGTTSFKRKKILETRDLFTVRQLWAQLDPQLGDQLLPSWKDKVCPTSSSWEANRGPGVNLQPTLIPSLCRTSPLNISRVQKRQQSAFRRDSEHKSSQPRVFCSSRCFTVELANSEAKN